MNTKLKSGVTIMDHMVTTNEWNEVMLEDQRAPGMTLTMVSAIEADKYAAAIGGRLPTGEEWEEFCGQEHAYGAFWEWTLTAIDGPTTIRVVRGGAWNFRTDDCRAWNLRTDDCRAEFRRWFRPDTRYGTLGFRVCWDKEQL